MVWKTRDAHFLLQGREYPLYLSGSGYGVILPDGREIKTAAEYFEVSETGRLIKKFQRPITTTLEDALFVQNVHIIVDCALVRFLITENKERGSIQQTQLLWGLVDFGNKDIPFDVKIFTD